jgi:hypothetical protein
VEGQRKALIVANDQYEHGGLGHLLSPGADADALGGVLRDPQIGGFTVRVVRNEPAHVIGAYIEDLFSDSRPDDVLLLHFSCHGLKSESGELFFAAPNTRPNRLVSTAVSADLVQRCMRASRSRRVVLLLDCCYGGAFSEGVTVRASGEANVFDSFAGARLGGGRGRAVITASSSMEYAFEGDRLADETIQRPSVFTSALVEGMATGEADRDEDGWISLNELYDYVFDRVRERNPNQTPSRDVEMQGELYVARSRRRRVHPQPIPSDLHAAMSDPNMFSRLGAVTELRARLTSDNLPVAAGAHEALRQIAGTDIQYVAETARVAMNDAAIQPAERELHFGEVTVGGEAGVRMVRLLGPPLARACTAQSAQSWIRVADTAEGITVSVDTSRVGAHRGSLTVKGPTGEVVISVDVEFTTPPPGQPSGGQRVGSAPPQPLPPQPLDTGAAEPAISRRESPWPVRIAVLMLVAGAGNVLLGVALPTIKGDQARIRTFTIQITVYAVCWAVLAAAPRDANRVRRITLAALGAVALLVVVWLIANSMLYLDYWELRETPLYYFWLVAGALEISAALLGGSRPTRRLELVSGALTTAFGLFLLYSVNQEWSPGWTVGSGSLYLITLGLTWVLIGLSRYRTTRLTE